MNPYIRTELTAFPPEGASIAAIPSNFSEYRHLQKELQYLEDRLAAEPDRDDLHVWYRKTFLRYRLALLLAEQDLSRLPSPRQRMLLRARYLEGQSWQEIAGEWRLSLSTLYALHRQALAILAEIKAP